MRIGELAAEAGVHIQTIRFYERRELLKKPRRLRSGYRDYSADAVRRVRFIKTGQEVGFTLKEIQNLIRMRDQRLHNASQVRAVVEGKIQSIDEKIQTLQAMRGELRKLLRNCRCGEAQPICPAIEALDL